VLVFIVGSVTSGLATIFAVTPIVLLLRRCLSSFSHHQQLLLVEA
jgi:hypothetical protein